MCFGRQDGKDRRYNTVSKCQNLFQEFFDPHGGQTPLLGETIHVIPDTPQPAFSRITILAESPLASAPSSACKSSCIWPLDTPFKYNQAAAANRLPDLRTYGGTSEEQNVTDEPPSRTRTFGTYTRTGPIPVCNSRTGSRPLRTTVARPSARRRSEWRPSKSCTSVSIASLSNRRAALLQYLQQRILRGRLRHRNYFIIRHGGISLLPCLVRFILPQGMPLFFIAATSSIHQIWQ